MANDEDMVCICPQCGFISFSLPSSKCSSCKCSIIDTGVTMDEYLDWDDAKQARWEIETIKRYAPHATDALKEAEEKLRVSSLELMMCICPKCGTIASSLPGEKCSTCKCEFVFTDVTSDEYVNWSDEKQHHWEAELTAKYSSGFSPEAIRHRAEQKQAWEELQDIMNHPSTPTVPELSDSPAETHIHITFDSPKPSGEFDGWFGRRKSGNSGGGSGGFSTGGSSRGGGAGRK